MKLRSSRITKPISKVAKQNVKQNNVTKSSTSSLIYRIRKELEFHRKKNYLPKDSMILKPHVLEWCFPQSAFSQNLTVQREKEWSKTLLDYNTNQWTTKVGEQILGEILLCLGKHPRRVSSRMRGENGKQLVPDFETRDALYECKARTYTTTGTAGEKILGTPWKYSDCHKLYHKPLYIVCMAYQEKEAESDFCLFNTKSDIRKKMLDFYAKEAGIYYIRFTDLLKQLIN